MRRETILGMEMNKLSESGSDTESKLLTIAGTIAITLGALVDELRVHNDILYDLTYKTEVQRREEKRKEMRK